MGTHDLHEMYVLSLPLRQITCANVTTITERGQYPDIDREGVIF